MSYIKVASDQAATLEAASGPHSTFLRTIAQHREVETQIPIKWVPRKQDEEGPAYLARCLGLRTADTKGLAHRRGEGASLGLIGELPRQGEA
eukprot:14944825-Alexandrium_andersonii.AAC.1